MEINIIGNTLCNQNKYIGCSLGSCWNRISFGGNGEFIRHRVE